jgi:putative membrane protein
VLGFILYFVVMTCAMLLLSRLLPGFHVAGWVPALIGSVVLAAINTVLKPILFVLTLPFTIVTLGLFLLILNAFCLWLAQRLVPGFEIHGFLTTLLASIILAVVGMVWKSVSKSAARNARQERA